MIISSSELSRHPAKEGIEVVLNNCSWPCNTGRYGSNSQSL